MKLWQDDSYSSSLWSRALLDRDNEDVVILNNIICSTKFPSGKDELVWEITKTNYSTKACIEYMMQSENAIGSSQKIWKEI